MQLIARRYGAPEARIALSPADFVATGGQGTVHARDGVAYKIYSDLKHMPPMAKWAELRAVRDPRLIVPTGTLHDLQGNPVGICMPFIADATPLARLATGSFRRRNGIDEAQVIGALDALRQAIAAAHAQGVHIVDLNPYNVLVTAGATDVVVIDADSWQTPSHPATAVLDAVRDRHATAFDARSDWFAFAVVAAWTLLGVHPYKGTHPTVSGLDARMTANASVFDDQVRRPPSARDPADLPATIRGWLEAVLHRGDRTPPPPFTATALRLPSLRTHAPIAVTLTAVIQADAPIQACAEVGGVRWWITHAGVFRDGRRTMPRPEGQIALAARLDRVLIGAVGQAGLTVADAMNGDALQCTLAARAVTAVEGTLVALTADALVALKPVGKAVAPRIIARVRPATQLFDGVAIQPLPGGCEAIVPIGAGVARARLPVSLSRITSARAEGGVLRVVAEDRAWTVRVDGRETDIRETATDLPDADLITLPQGLTVMRVAGDAVSIEPVKPHSRGARVVQDAAWAGEGQLVRLDTAVGLMRGRQVWRAQMR